MANKKLGFLVILILLCVCVPQKPVVTPVQVPLPPLPDPEELYEKGKAKEEIKKSLKLLQGEVKEIEMAIIRVNEKGWQKKAEKLKIKLEDVEEKIKECELILVS